jgi:UPF0042 nucleotide-binding protein
MTHPNIIILTGHSGSGKSTAIAALEDAGFYCVDNLPIALLPDFLKLSLQGVRDVAGFAFVMDLREKGFLESYTTIFANLKKNGYSIEIIFLEADEKTLLKRFKQTRRPHPLAINQSLMEGIRLEGRLLKELRNMANRVIDTSNCTVHELKFLILKIAKKCAAMTPMVIQVMSFGFKYGIPLDADLIIDVRFLSNPYFVPELKPLDGTNEKIRTFVLNNNETILFLQKYLNLLDFLLPLYEKEGKAYLTIAVGCTGGRHRSVVLANTIGEHIIKMNEMNSQMQKQISITHRDIGHTS